MKIFVAGSTGYLASKLIPNLLSRGHTVRALSRSGSEKKVPAGCEIVIGDALNAGTYQDAVQADTFVHLIGVPHPSPAKAPLFRAVDLPAVYASVSAAMHAQVLHFVYLSVAHPASVMKAYVQSRIEAEDHIQKSGLNATFLRPWYVLGPGHRWAYLLLPAYKICEIIPQTRETALRLGLVTLRQMTRALVDAVETPVSGIRIVEVPEIRKLGEPGS